MERGESPTSCGRFAAQLQRLPPQVFSVNLLQLSALILDYSEAVVVRLSVIDTDFDASNIRVSTRLQPHTVSFLAVAGTIDFSFTPERSQTPPSCHITIRRYNRQRKRLARCPCRVSSSCFLLSDHMWKSIFRRCSFRARGSTFLNVLLPKIPKHSPTTLLQFNSHCCSRRLLRRFHPVPSVPYRSRDRLVKTVSLPTFHQLWLQILVLLSLVSQMWHSLRKSPFSTRHMKKTG